MGDRSAFFYGTLMAPQVLHRVIFGTSTPTTEQSRRLIIVPALLPKYARHRVRECDYPAIIPSEQVGACVRGTLVRGLTTGDQWRLDLFEGSQYNRIKVRPRILRASGEEGDEVEAETYVWADEVTDLQPGEWDFEEFRKEKMRRWVGNDDEYEEVDEAVRATNDPTGGRSVNGHIGEQLEAKNGVGEDILQSAV